MRNRHKQREEESDEPVYYFSKDELQRLMILVGALNYQDYASDKTKALILKCKQMTNLGRVVILRFPDLDYI